jgi:hypothetical protein
VTDSLVLGGVIELLGGGIASTHPQCAGAIFALGAEEQWDMGAPQLTYEQTASLLLDGEVVTGWRASNRTPTIPVVIKVPSTGDDDADRLTLAGARELVLQVTAADYWELTWTRSAGDPLIFDCMGLSATTIHSSIKHEQQLIAQLEITFQAFPYGRSDVQETIAFNSPAQQFPQPPTPDTLDDFVNFTNNFLRGTNSTFETGVGTWVADANCTVAQSSTQAHAGTFSLRLSSTAAGSMSAGSCSAASVAPTDASPANGMAVHPGDTVAVSGWFRAGATGRSCNMGADFYTSNGTFISTLRGSNTSDVTTSFTQISASLTAPNNAAWCRANPQVVSTGAGAELHYVDDVTMNRGTVYSDVDPSQWYKSTVTPFSGENSARWPAVAHDCPVYDHTEPAAIDITGNTKFGFWLGLGNSATQWHTWHKGKVTFLFTLYDGTGQALTFGTVVSCQASALATMPHWQYVSAAIPQVAAGFDYTTLSRYVIQAWNLWDATRTDPITGKKGVPALQAGAFISHVQAVPTSTGAVVNRSLWATLPGIVGSARSPLGLQAAPGPSAFSTVSEFTTPGSNAFSTPVGVTNMDKAEAWGTGGGGAGADSGTGKSGGGGQGGEYAAEFNIPVTASTSYPATVGAIGVGGTGQNGGVNDATWGGDSFWTGNGGANVYAHGGARGQRQTVTGGKDGGSGSPNSIHYSGGTGWPSNVTGTPDGGGGGGSGGKASPGNDGGNGRTPGAAVADGGPGGYGGKHSGLGGLSIHGASPTIGPGGGGGGGTAPGGPGNGAAGKAGKIRLTYGASGILAMQSLLVHMPAASAPDALSPVCVVGNGNDTPNGGTEYLVPVVGALNPRFDGCYSVYVVVKTWNTPSAARTITVQLRQYPFTAGTAVTQNVVRTLTPNTDLTGTLQYVDMGPVTLPLADIPPGSLSPYFALTVTSTNTSDRYYDVLFLDTQGQLWLLDVGGASIFKNIWLDQPDSSRGLGRVLGSDVDRDRAVSATQYLTRASGGPLAVYPGRNNRLLAYSAQGCPGVTAFYPPQWWSERLS